MRGRGVDASVDALEGPFPSRARTTFPMMLGEGSVVTKETRADGVGGRAKRGRYSQVGSWAPAADTAAMLG